MLFFVVVVVVVQNAKIAQMLCNNKQQMVCIIMYVPIHSHILTLARKKRNTFQLDICVLCVVVTKKNKRISKSTTFK